MNFKIFRIGHRIPKQGVITIASEIVNGKIYFGASFSSPKEKQYDKQLGIDTAKDRLEKAKQSEIFIVMPEDSLKHVAIINLLMDAVYPLSPLWAKRLIDERLRYPAGLKRGSKNSITIEIDSDKVTQLQLALKYMKEHGNLDSGFDMVNALLNCTVIGI